MSQPFKNVQAGRDSQKLQTQKLKAEFILHIFQPHYFNKNRQGYGETEQKECGVTSHTWDKEQDKEIHFSS